MRYVKVKYDAYSGKFRMAETGSAETLDIGGLYLVADLAEEEFLPVGDLDFVNDVHVSA